MGRRSLVAVAAAAMTGSVTAFVGAPASVSHLKPRLAVCAVDRPGLALRAWGGTRKDATAEPDADADARGAYDVDKQYDADINGYANPMATGAYVEDGWVDESAPASSGPGLFGMLFGGNKKSANASELAKKEALERDLDKIEFVDGTTGSLSFASRAGTAVPFGGLNPVQVEKYEVDGKLVGERGVDGEKAPAGGYMPMSDKTKTLFIKYPEKKPLPSGWYSATDEVSGQDYFYSDDGTTTWERPE